MSYEQIQDQTFSLLDKISQLLDRIVPQVIAALVLVALYLLEALHGPTITPLLELQQNEWYKQITGFLLMAYVLYQLRLAILRMSHKKINNTLETNRHIWFGVFTPLALFIHSSQLGYGYQALLAGMFLFNVLIGLCSPKFLKIRHKSYIVVWLVIHSGIAVIVPVLLMYHLYVIYFYD